MRKKENLDDQLMYLSEIRCMDVKAIAVESGCKKDVVLERFENMGIFTFKISPNVDAVERDGFYKYARVWLKKALARNNINALPKLTVGEKMSLNKAARYSGLSITSFRDIIEPYLSEPMEERSLGNGMVPAKLILRSDVDKMIQSKIVSECVGDDDEDEYQPKADEPDVAIKLDLLLDKSNEIIKRIESLERMWR